jgi:transcriptional regulator with XRE-family HTH domain
MLGDIIKNARKSKRIMQKELAEMLHVRPSTVSMWEAGTRTPDIQTLVNLSKSLEIPLSDLIKEMYDEKKEAPAGESKSEADIIFHDDPEIAEMLIESRTELEWREMLGKLSRENKLKLLEYARLLLLSQAREHPEGQE